MRRRALKITMFLLAGVLLNVAVAWGCAAWVGVGPSDVVLTGWLNDPNLRSGHRWALTQYRAFGTTRVLAMVRQSERFVIPLDAEHLRGALPEDVVPHWSSLLDAALRQSLDNRNGLDVLPCVIYEDGRGWPLRALCCRW